MALQPESPNASNDRGIKLRASGRLEEAVAVFRAGVESFPNEIALRQNFAQALYESGDTAGAIAQHRTVLAIDEGSTASHLALYELYQVTGDREASHTHQRHALERRRLFSAIAQRQARTVLILCAPGDWQANIPVDFLFDRETTTVHKLYLLDAAHLDRDRLPAYDVAWNAIAESPDAIPYLALAEMILGSQRKPRLNTPGHVLATSRILLPHTLASSDAVVTQGAEIARDRVASAQISFPYPVLVRPVGSHAGHGLEKLDRAEDLASYVERNPAERYFVCPFFDYRSSDGYYRKYRIVFVDGIPYPVHLAISRRWMIHYYNAEMAENAWMREEEARFLADIRSVFDGERHRTLLGIADAVRLEYFGIDCALMPDGRVLVFEADPAMLVHTSDPIELYPYKREYVPRIFRAVERMIDERKAADT
jgi:tetratricopeptide (TPR) repeat protein